ncbi:MAG: hypothetical protein AB7U83_09520 [Vicinamibacterales bacterium]
MSSRRRHLWLVAVVVAAYLSTLGAIGGVSATVLGLVVQSLVMLPGITAVARLAEPGQRWLATAAFGPAVGLGASSLALLGLWAGGGRGVWVVPAAAAIAMMALLPARRLRGRWRLPDPAPGDLAMLLVALLLVPLLVARPFSLVGLEIPEGHVYRAYFTADYVWRRAVVAELAKGSFLPANPYYVGDVLHYYWLPHLLSAVEYRAWGPAVSLDTLLLTRSVLVDAAFVAALYGVARLAVPAPWAALVGVLCGFLATSAEGVVGLWVHWAQGAPLSLVRYLNIDAVSRWIFGGMPIDGLQRVLWYQPHHATGYVLGMLGLLAVARRTRDRDPAVFAVAGSLLAASTLISSFAGVMFTVAAATFEAGRTIARRLWGPAIFNAAYAALPLAVGAAVVTLLEYVDHPAGTNLSVIRLGVNPLALVHFWQVTAMSAGPILLLGLAGLVAAVRHRRSDVWPFAAAIVTGAWFYVYVDVRDHQDVYVGWRVGHLVFMALIPCVGVAAAAVAALPTRLGRSLGLTAAAVAVAVALPTVAIDFYNTQDIVQREMGPGFRWVQILSPAEWDGLMWLRDHTPAEAVVQVDAYARDADTWAYIPAFAERRMGVGLPISMVPLLKYQEGSRVVQWMYDVDDATSTFSTAARVGIDYIVVGDPERRAHPGVEARFARQPDLLPLVFHNDALSIYQVHRRRH